MDWKCGTFRAIFLLDRKVASHRGIPSHHGIAFARNLP